MDEVWKREERQSPCVKICVMHPESKLCIGCYRTNAEIAAWGRMSREERQEIMAELPAREPLLKPKRRGGRKRRA
ncbi:DUF1289 domain-containing protein [Amylibacter sp. SFDW26]|uniref:DUF1289 domain-containing protein n=1 Tax=Amylibacter sp. SFDW26 TaxID=2652722 RepID=UPI0012629458|nr:DUF1289 domain-containing protein [Amylibacter sp. SFDW26]KAB7610288.1 DUF1289 domain-containing protein [Amylibacter sp. SFDW26]